MRRRGVLLVEDVRRFLVERGKYRRISSMYIVGHAKKTLKKRRTRDRGQGMRVGEL